MRSGRAFSNSRSTEGAAPEGRRHTRKRARKMVLVALNSQVKIYPPIDTQAKCTEQSAANVPLRSTGTQGAPCRKQQAGRE